MPKTKQSRRAASLMDLKSKPARTKEVLIEIPDDEILVITVRSINTLAYDNLVSEHPPTKEEKADGNSYHLDTFAPALMSACTIEPQLSAADAEELWQSDDWARGELFDWFFACVEMCNKGLQVPSTASD